MTDIKALFILLLVFIPGLSYSQGYDFMVNGIYYNALSLHDNPSCEVTGGDGWDKLKYRGIVRIPSSVSYKGKMFKVVRIGESCFQGNEISTVVIPASVEEIGDYAFKGSELSSISLPNSITRIGNGAFDGCENLRSIVLPNSVTDLEMNVFLDCSNLVNVSLPRYIKKLPHGTFSGCKSLRTVTIPDEVETLDYDVFCDCEKLTAILLPRGLKTIGGSAFANCSALRELVCLNPEPPEFMFNSAFYGVSMQDCVLKVPHEAVETYKRTAEWGKFWNIKGGTSLSFNAFTKPTPTPESAPVKTPEPEIQDDRIYDVVEQWPFFAEGRVHEWIAKNIQYPPGLGEKKIEGRVIVQFVVLKDGSLSDVVVVRKVHDALDKEALRVVGLMPKWIPGKQNGRPVNCKYTLPVVFRAP